MPTISIISICFNNLQELLNTCESVDKQIPKPFEHIIINGSTTTVIKEYFETNPQPVYRRCISERDEGIADAFNKGILQAKGDVTILLNSGDTLYDETVIQRVQKAFDEDENLMWTNGKLELLRGDIWVIVGKPFDRSKLYRGMRSVFHPTMFVKRELYEKHGLFKKELKMAMDYDFLCRIADEKNRFLDYPIARFDPTGISTSKYLDAMRESYAAYRSYFGSSTMQTLWGWRLTFLHHLLQSDFGKMLYRLKVKLGLANK